jgi:hypothetical protein
VLYGALRGSRGSAGFRDASPRQERQRWIRGLFHHSPARRRGLIIELGGGAVDVHLHSVVVYRAASAVTRASDAPKRRARFVAGDRHWLLFVGACAEHHVVAREEHQPAIVERESEATQGPGYAARIGDSGTGPEPAIG